MDPVQRVEIFHRLEVCAANKSDWQGQKVAVCVCEKPWQWHSSPISARHHFQYYMGSNVAMEVGRSVSERVQ